MNRGRSPTSHPRSPLSDNRVALCFEVDDVDAEAVRLRALGVKVEIAPRNHEPWGMRTTYLRDPAGNLIELYSALKR